MGRAISSRIPARPRNQKAGSAT